MKEKKKNLIDLFYLILSLLIFITGIYLIYDYFKAIKEEKELSNLKLDVKLPFNKMISNKYTCDGKNMNFPIIIVNYNKIKKIEEKYGFNFTIKVELRDKKGKIIWNEIFPLKYKIEEGKAVNYKGICPPLEYSEIYYLTLLLIENKKKNKVITYYNKRLFYKRINILDVFYNLSKNI